MTTLRRFLVVNALMVWQGGFLFYAAVVVPIGTEVLSSFDQGRVTRHVTNTQNLIGLFALLILAWDQFVAGPLRRARWTLWLAMAVTLAGLWLTHPMVERYVDFAADGKVREYGPFYQWHRAYLYLSTACWLAALGYAWVTVQAWRSDRSS